MSEGVLVVTPQGRLQFVNDAARRMLKVEDAPEGRHYLEIARHPDIAGRDQCGALHGLSGEGRELTLGGDGRRDIRRARRARRVGRRPRRGSGAARHHRTAQRRSHPPRLRRQRLARAANAADRGPRLRRSAARRRVRCSGCAAVPGDDCAAHVPHGAACPRPAAAGAARRRTGAARPGAVRDRLAASTPSIADVSSETRSARAAGGAAMSIPTRTSSSGIPRNCTMRCETCSTTRPVTRPKAATIDHRRRPQGRPDRADRRRRRPRIPEADLPRVSNASIASTRRARGTRAIRGHRVSVSRS